jgi:hypothetical protein
LFFVTFSIFNSPKTPFLEVLAGCCMHKLCLHFWKVNFHARKLSLQVQTVFSKANRFIGKIPEIKLYLFLVIDFNQTNIDLKFLFYHIAQKFMSKNRFIFLLLK